MAYSKKVSRRYRRAGRARRYTRRRRYRRKYSRRSGKRFPKGTEVKSISKTFNGSVTPANSTANDVQFLKFYPGHFVVIGGGSGANCIYIPQGTAQGQRVGAKIEPVKLRVSGAFSLSPKAADQVQYAPNFWQIRLLVYQVKGGNSSYEATNENYHQLAMNGTTGNIIAGDLIKLFPNYFFSSSTTQDGVTYTGANWRANNSIGKVPLRRGIGGLCRVLYKKTFWINTQKNPVKQFRFITKVPRRFVYPESTTSPSGDTTANVANNAVYILWVYQPGAFDVSAVPNLHYDYHVDLFYTDK